MNAKVAFYDAKCLALKLSRQLKSFFSTTQNHDYLFILSPPYNGSTLLNELLCTSTNVSSANIFGTREGLGLPEVRKLIDYRKHWDENYDFPWQLIKKQWLKYWDASKSVFLDKSQPVLLRGQAISACFEPAFFIILVRHPYALCESYIRRDKMTALDAAKFSIRCLQVQQKNVAQLKNNLILKYEDFTNDPSLSSKRMIDFLPSIKTLDTNRTFKAHNFKNKAMGITNLNEEKLKNLSIADKKIIHHYLTTHISVIHFFGYTIK